MFSEFVCGWSGCWVVDVEFLFDLCFDGQGDVGVVEQECVSVFFVLVQLIVVVGVL